MASSIDKCFQCEQSLDEIELDPMSLSPGGTEGGEGGQLRKKSSNATTPYETDLQDDSVSFVMVERRSEDFKRKVERDLKKQFNAQVKKPNGMKISACKNCLEYMRTLYKEDSINLKDKQELSEEVLIKTKRVFEYLSASTSNNQLELALKERERLKRELMIMGKKLEEERSAFNQIKQDAKLLSEQEMKFTQEAMKWRGDKHKYQEKWDASLMRMNYASQELEIKSVILSDSFHIHEEQPPYVSINGLRMGRKPNNDVSEKHWNVAEGATALPASEYQEVEWSEVNAAWGEACLLLCVLAHKANLVFKDYKLIPRGSYSVVQEKKNPEIFHRLYFEADDNSPAGASVFEWGLSVLRIGGTNQSLESFNQAMMGFMICLKELAEAIRDTQRGTQLNLRNKLFPIKSETMIIRNVSNSSPNPLSNQQTSVYMDATIKGLSIKTTTDPSDARRWTDACKFMLSNVKWITVWAAGIGKKG